MNSTPIEDEEQQGTRYLIRDLLMRESMSQPEIAASLGCPKTSVSYNLTRLRQEGYTVNIVGKKPSTNGKGFGAPIYSIDSRPQPPVVKHFSLDALWHPRKVA